MRSGHDCSSDSEEGFEPDVGAQIVLMTVKQRKLVDEHRSQGEARGVVGLSLRGHHRPVSVKNGLEKCSLKFSIAT